MSTPDLRAEHWTQIKPLIDKGLKQREVAEQLKMQKSRVSEVYRWATRGVAKKGKQPRAPKQSRQVDLAALAPSREANPNQEVLGYLSTAMNLLVLVEQKLTGGNNGR